MIVVLFVNISVHCLLKMKFNQQFQTFHKTKKIIMAAINHKQMRKMVAMSMYHMY